ncbi:MAG TPA: YfiR family protein [Rhizomicrobium sp.]|nr:YfiR family protein [Rhizomicrobium sp.]
MRKTRQVLHRLAIFSAGLLAFSPAHAQTSLEYAVKAAYLTKFAPFVDWPDTAFASASAPVTICILGTDPFGDAIDKAAARSAAGNGRPLAIRRISSADAANGCHIVFDGDPGVGSLDSLSGKPVVTVTDSTAPAHGVIRFVTLDNHVRFDIDDAAAARSGIRISSKLLELAHSVTRRSGP